MIKKNQNDGGYAQAIESSRKAHDATFLNYMAEIYDAFDRYYQKNNFYPWQNNVQSNIQILDNVNRNILQKLVNSKDIKENFMNIVSNSESKITLLNNGDKTYLCVEPQSKIIKSKAKKICSKDINIKETIVCTTDYEEMCVSSDLSYYEYFN